MPRARGCAASAGAAGSSRTRASRHCCDPSTVPPRPSPDRTGSRSAPTIGPDAEVAASILPITANILSCGWRGVHAEYSCHGIRIAAARIESLPLESANAGGQLGMTRVGSSSSRSHSLPLARPADDSRPASSNVLNAQYPRIHPDGRVTFRLSPRRNAQKVQLQPGGNDNGLGKGPIDMTSDEKGVWTMTTPSAVPGFHYYWFLVDGVIVNDPGSETFFGWGRQTSGIEVPENGRRLLRAAGRPAWRGARPLVSVEDHRRAGAGRTSTRRRTTTRITRRAIPCCIFSTAQARTRPAGRSRDGPT